MNPIIVDTMNDIINQVETREWNRVNEHRFRMMKKWKREKAKVEEMKDDWEVATQKIAEENGEMKRWIERTKKSHAETCSYWRIKVMTLEEENKCLKKERDKYLENWKSTTRKYVAVTTREQRLKALTDK